MFTGIIKHTAELVEKEISGSSAILTFQSELTPHLHIDQSVSHNGVCLTVEKIDGEKYRVTAVKETLQRTTLGKWVPGRKVNLELSATPTTLLDGHIVQGHIDCRATVSRIEEAGGSWFFYFELPTKFHHLIVEKGSVAVDGVSLTIASLDSKGFSVAIIPYTFEHTGFSSLNTRDEVNLEFDVIGKYVSRILNAKNV